MAAGGHTVKVARVVACQWRSATPQESKKMVRQQRPGRAGWQTCCRLGHHLGVRGGAAMDGAASSNSAGWCLRHQDM